MKESKFNFFSLTIIICVYNASSTILDTIFSIISSYESEFPLEILIINDGSTDDTLVKLESVSKTSNVEMRILSTKNNGVLSARIFGIKNSKYEYIYFVDSDDIVDLNFFHELYLGIRRNVSDLYVVSIMKHKCGKIISLYGFDNEIIEYKTFIKSLVVDGDLGYSASKIFKKSLLNIEHLESSLPTFRINYSEDMLISLFYALNVKTICFLPKCKYHYLDLNESSTNNISYAKLLSYIYVAKNRFDFFNKFMLDYNLDFSSILGSQVFSLIVEYSFYGNGHFLSRFRKSKKILKNLFLSRIINKRMFKYLSYKYIIFYIVLKLVII